MIVSIFNGLIQAVALPEIMGTFIGFGVVVWMIFHASKGGFSFHENEILRRRLKRIDEVKASKGLSESEQAFLENAGLVERLNIISSIKTTPNGARLVHKLYNTGQFPIKHLKIALPYLNDIDGKVKAKMDWIDKFQGIVSGLGALGILIYGYVQMITLMFFKTDEPQIIAGIVVFSVFALIAVVTVQPFAKMRKYDFVVEKLQENDMYYSQHIDTAKAETITPSHTDDQETPQKPADAA